MKKLSIYIASSWKQEKRVTNLAVYLRGHDNIIAEVYDFTDSKCGAAPFKWSDLTNINAPFSLSLSEKLRHHPVAAKAYQQDMLAMQRADVCILLLPAGASAHSEAGWFAGKGKPVIVISPTAIDNIELMYNMYDRIIGDANINSLYDKLTTYLDQIAKQEAPKNETEPSEFCPVKTDNILAAIGPQTQVLVKSESGRIGYVELDHVRALINPDKKSEKQPNLAELIGTVVNYRCKKQYLDGLIATVNSLGAEKNRLVDELIAAINYYETKV